MKNERKYSSKGRPASGKGGTKTLSAKNANALLKLFDLSAGAKFAIWSSQANCNLNDRCTDQGIMLNSGVEYRDYNLWLKGFSLDDEVQGIPTESTGRNNRISAS